MKLLVYRRTHQLFCYREFRRTHMPIHLLGPESLQRLEGTGMPWTAQSTSNISCWQPFPPPLLVRELHQRRKTAVVLTTITPQTKSFPERHGIWVILSGRLQSLRIRPTGSFVAGTPADTKALVTRSFRCWCLTILLGACLQTRLCWPRASTVAPQRQVWGAPKFKPDEVLPPH